MFPRDFPSQIADSSMGGRKAIAEQLVCDYSSLQDKFRLKEAEAQALTQRCHDLEAERDSIQAAYDLTRACQAAMLNNRADATHRSSQLSSSYYVPLQQPRQDSVHQGKSSGTNRACDSRRECDKGVCDAEDPHQPCHIQ